MENFKKFYFSIAAISILGLTYLPEHTPLLKPAASVILENPGEAWRIFTGEEQPDGSLISQTVNNSVVTCEVGSNAGSESSDQPAYSITYDKDGRIIAEDRGEKHSPIPLNEESRWVTERNHKNLCKYIKDLAQSVRLIPGRPFEESGIKLEMKLKS